MSALWTAGGHLGMMAAVTMRAVILLSFALAACSVESDSDAALDAAQAAITAAVCAQDRTELAGALSALAEAADGLDPETRDSAINDMAMDARCEPVAG